MVRLRGGKPFGGYRLERPPFFQENCIFAGERFPSADCYVDDAGFQFHCQREPADRLGCNKRGSAAQEWIVDRLTGVAVVLHWSSHALDWLLRRMRGFGILVTAGNAPQSRLLPITGPMPLGSDRVPTGLMLPMIIAASDDETFLGPDDLGADLKPLSDQTFSNSHGVKAPCQT